MKKIIDYIDFEKVNTLLEGFNQSTGFVTAILDLDGNVLSKSGWRQICVDFHRVNSKTSDRCTISDTILASKLAKGEKYHFYKCLNGLIDVAVPVIIKDQHIANLFSGQFFFEEPDRTYFQKQAIRFSFDEKVYLEALDMVPIVSEQQVKTMMEFLLNMTKLISEITLQKMDLLELNKALQISEERYRLVLENSMDAVLLTFPDGSIISANAAACNMFQRSEEEICELGRNGLVYMNDPRIPQMLEERDRTGKAKGELMMIRKDGTIFPVELSASLYTDQSGARRSSIIIRDITDRKITEQQLIISKEKAEESDSLKTAFLQNMSHEIRTPMNAIMGFSALLSENCTDISKIQKYSQIITQRSNDLLSIINDVLDIAKIESGQLHVNVEECKLQQLFKELEPVLREYQKRIGKNCLEFNLSIADSIEQLSIKTDIVKLKQILINLVSNAFKFTEKGFVELHCKSDRAGYIKFEVNDSGVGIPKDKHEAVFERFFQLRQSFNTQGTGLGLPIAKGLVMLLGGEIKISSEPGKGSTFTCIFPSHT